MQWEGVELGERCDCERDEVQCFLPKEREDEVNTDPSDDDDGLDEDGDGLDEEDDVFDEL